MVAQICARRAGDSQSRLDCFGRQRRIGASIDGHHWSFRPFGADFGKPNPFLCPRVVTVLECLSRVSLVAMMRYPLIAMPNA